MKAMLTGIRLLVGCAVPVAAQAQLTISDNGSASYTFPIAVPPGIAGMSPKLALSYSGGALNGPVGYGWSFQGISAITRCPPSRPIDGVMATVKYGPHDKLCLEGQRLIPLDANGAAVVGKTTGDAAGLGEGASREYRTEKDSFARIRAYGYANGDTTGESGPAYFKVWTKSGQVHEYGTRGADAQALINVQGKTTASVWALARVSDVFGNYMDFKYEQRDVDWGSRESSAAVLGHEWTLSEIQYTGNGTQLPVNKVVFRYDDRAFDRSEAYHQGTKNVSVRRLYAIDTYINSPNPSALGPGANAVLVKRVKLAYGASDVDKTVTMRSRIKAITECADSGETKCLPPTTFTYTPGATDAFSVNTEFGSSALATTALMNSSNTMGVIPVDFNGDGRADLLRWSDTPADNKLYKSEGNGRFTQVPGFNLTTEKLYSSDQCYVSQVADFNADGVMDILRLVNVKSKTGTACSGRTHSLYLSNLDGTFSSRQIPSSIVLDKTQPEESTLYCPSPSGCIKSRTEGRYFYVLDADSDGYLDIVTSILPGYSGQYILNNGSGGPSDESLCASITCTRVFRGSADGTFTEVSTDAVHRSLYRQPSWDKPPSWGGTGFYAVGDADGDGVSDIFATSGTWAPSFAGGSVNFERLTDPFAMPCTEGMDVNGDGKIDCLSPALSAPSNTPNASYNSLSINTGRKLASTPTFNLLGPGVQLVGGPYGYQLLDANGDGLTDILRWGDDPAQNRLYLSSGNGGFSTSTTFNLTSSSHQLRSTDGTADMVLADFLGNGKPQILRLKHNPTAGLATSNQLFMQIDTTPPDLLMGVKTSLGAEATVIYAPLTDSAGGYYTSDRGTANAAQYPKVDVLMPAYVAVRVLESGVQGPPVTLNSKLAYAGLKADVNRGLLGFRQVKRESFGPNGESLTTATEYLQDHPYIGVPARSETLRGSLEATNAMWISRTTSIYCDKAAAAGADAAAIQNLKSCPVPSQTYLLKPYLLHTIEEGQDLNGHSLPTVYTTNTYNDYGDPTEIKIAKKGTTSFGLYQEFTTTTKNTYAAVNTTGDNWVLGRLERATVTNVVPNSIASIPSSAGSAPQAAATTGQLPPGTKIPMPYLQAILSLLLDD